MTMNHSLKDALFLLCNIAILLGEVKCFLSYGSPKAVVESSAFTVHKCCWEINDVYYYHRLKSRRRVRHAVLHEDNSSGVLMSEEAQVDSAVEALTSKIHQLEQQAEATLVLARELRGELEQLKSSLKTPDSPLSPAGLEPNLVIEAAPSLQKPPLFSSTKQQQQGLYELPSSYTALGPPIPQSELEKANSANEWLVTIGSEEHFDAVMETAGKEGHSSVDEEGVVRNAHKVVVVMVYGDWCRACMHIKPKFAQLCKEHPAVLGMRINSGEISSLSKRLGVRGLPTFIVFQNGSRRDHFAVKNKDDLEEHILDYI